MSVGSIFKSVVSFFEKGFVKAQPVTTAALSTIQTFGPDLEIVWSLVDPTSEAEAAPIINEVTADLGTVAALLKSGNSAGVPGFLTSIKSNLSTLLTESHIKDPASQARATGIIGAISAEIENILEALPAPIASTTVA